MGSQRSTVPQTFGGPVDGGGGAREPRNVWLEKQEGARNEALKTEGQGGHGKGSDSPLGDDW